MTRRLLSLLVLVVCGAGGAVSAQERGGLDPRASADRPDCVTRRVTGPGGAYRWDRVECEADLGWSDFDRWAYSRPLDVEPLQGDRYGGWWRTVPDVRAGAPSQAPRLAIQVAGRDAGGYLTWPGKRP